MDSKKLADVKEIKNTTKFILNRLNTLTGCGEGCTCGLELEDLKNDFRDTEVRVRELQDEVNDLESEGSDEQTLKQIEDKIGELAQSFLALQSGYSQPSIQDIRDIKEVSMTRFRSNQKIENKVYAESNNDAFPVIGSRVRRGPDWTWDNQDHDWRGTVVGHSEDDYKVWVTWDFDNITTDYWYGLGAYEVLVKDEPRELKPGQNMAVGCRVKPGRDARMLDAIWSDISISTQGVVIRKNSPKAHVRWDNGKRGDYSYGKDGRYEIELWQSRDRENLDHCFGR